MGRLSRNFRILITLIIASFGYSHSQLYAKSFSVASSLKTNACIKSEEIWTTTCHYPGEKGACVFNAQINQSAVLKKNLVADIKFTTGNCPWKSEVVSRKKVANTLLSFDEVTIAKVQKISVDIPVNNINNTFRSVGQEIDALNSKVINALQNFPESIKTEEVINNIQVDLDNKYQKKIMELENRIKTLEQSQ